MDAPTVALHSPVTSDAGGTLEIPRPKLEHRRQIPSLTGLRFFAAFFILFAHAVDWIAQFQDSQISRYFSFVAGYGMPLFFVLSGFVIHYNYRDLFMKAGLTRAICEFAAARFSRLYPLYFCFLLLALGADEFVQNNYHAPQAAFEILGYYLTLTQSWWYLLYGEQSIIYQLFSPSWSISTEMYFYLLYAALIFGILALCRLRRAILLGVLYAAAASIALWALRYNLTAVLGVAERILPDYIPISGPKGFTFEHSFYRWLFYFSPYVRVLEFLLGCFVAQAFIDRGDKPVTAAEYRAGSLALWTALAFLVVAGLFFLAVFPLPLLNAYTQFFALNFLYAPAIAVVMFCVARYDTPFARFMSLPLFVALGETSYSIYLVHEWTLRIFEHPAQLFTVFWGFYAACRVVFAIAFTLLVSYGTYRLIELPGRAYVRGALRRQIVRVLGPADAPPKRSSGLKERASFQIVYTVAVVLALLVIAIGGQALWYGKLTKYARMLVFGPSPEISVISADYGLNCADFDVPKPLPKLTVPGYATKAVKTDCDGLSECRFDVTVDRLGDPASGCGKEFTVKYTCSGRPDVFSVFIPAEAHGHTAVLACPRGNDEKPDKSP